MTQSRLPSLFEMVSHLVAQPSVSSTLPEWNQGNRGVIDCLAAWCERLGFRVRLEAVDLKADKWNLIARIGPERPGGLVLSGHTDTVPFDAKRWSSDPFAVSERDGRWYGLGICDMKAFFALALQAAEPFLAQLNRPLTLVATADEESSMAGIRAMTGSLASLGQFVLIGEPTGMQPIYAHKGILMEELLIEGQSGHSSEPALGRNAIDAMSDALLIMRRVREGWQTRYHRSDFKVPSATLNFGCIHGGDNPNRICPSCRLHFDVRMMPGMTLGSVREELEAALQPVMNQHGVSFALTSLFKGVAPFAGRSDTDFVRRLEHLSGRSAGTVAFATEAPFFSEAGLQTLVLGPGDIAQAHQPDEYLALDRIQPCLDLFRQLISDICVEETLQGEEKEDD
ncbi:MAG: acetylornithine deacetylase [Hahellaceae bacterium]|nr:acetylornithine deacetylase [Hahellaceae bacterium]